MFQRRVPEWVRHAPTPGVKGLAALTGVEAMSRGVLVSVLPLAMFQVFGDAQTVSLIYFAVGLVSLLSGMMVPWLTRFIPRRWMCTFGAGLYILSAGLAILKLPMAMTAALLLYTVAAVTIFICVNAYVLDYIQQVELSRCETLRMFYGALAWTAGPVGGVWLMQWWFPAPFIVSAAAALGFISYFWWLRLGNGRVISKARGPAPNPIAFLARFFAQPRLIAGWLFAVLRSCGWWIYVVYLPIYAVQSGLGENVGGIALSMSNGLMFITPFMLIWMRRHSVRYAGRLGFFVSAVLFVAASIAAYTAAGLPWLAIGCLMAGSVALVLLDISAGLPFLMSVKPSERTEMSAVFASYRDVSGIITPGAAALVLLVAPLSWIFAVGGFGLFVAWAIAGRLHPRLGMRNKGVQRVPRPEGIDAPPPNIQPAEARPA